MKFIVTLAAFVLMNPNVAIAERAASPEDATVFIRLVGSVHAEVEELGLRQVADLDHIEVGTGSGFVISPYGYVLTNDHVVSSSEIVVTSGIRKTKISVKVAKIEVCFSAGASAARADPVRCAEALVHSSDPSLDLAVLFFSASNLPYVALGDSDVIRPGQNVDTLGYPFGRKLEVGHGATAPDLVPEISTTPGTISALRPGEAGERRYIQISSNVNPGNSGGPVLDRDGFAVGVIRMGVKGGAGITFAIPINQVKDFLESHALGSLMPVRRLQPGPLQGIEGKGVRLRMPEGLADISPFRSRIETDSRSADVALRIDRIFSPWTAKQIERTLTGTETFERFAAATSESRPLSREGSDPILLGRASGSTTDGDREVLMDYGILALGSEKLVARFIGSAEQVAYNESVLRESLASLQGQPLIVAELGSVQTLTWSASAAPAGQRGLPLPAGWVVEPGGPSGCNGLPPASGALTAFPAHDFTIALRAAVWDTENVVPETGAAACSSRRGSGGGTTYASHAEWLGVSYAIEGEFVRVGPGQVVQLEVVSPDQKSAFAHALLAAWIRKSTEH